MRNCISKKLFTTHRLQILATLLGLTCWLGSCQQVPQLMVGTASLSTFNTANSGYHCRHRNIHLYTHARDNTEHGCVARYT